MSNQCQLNQGPSKEEPKSKLMKQSDVIDSIQILNLLSANANGGAKNNAGFTPMQIQSKGKNSTQERVFATESALNTSGQSLASFFALNALSLRRNITTRITAFGGLLNRFALHATGKGIS